MGEYQNQTLKPIIAQMLSDCAKSMQTSFKEDIMPQHSESLMKRINDLKINETDAIVASLDAYMTEYHSQTLKPYIAHTFLDRTKSLQNTIKEDIMLKHNKSLERMNEL